MQDYEQFTQKLLGLVFNCLQMSLNRLSLKLTTKMNVLQSAETQALTLDHSLHLNSYL